MAPLRATRHLRVLLALVLVVGVVVPGAIALAHAHDASTPGLFNTQCPLSEAAAHTLAAALEPPPPTGLELAATPIPPLPESRPLDGVPASAAPRAPPLR